MEHQGILGGLSDVVLHAENWHALHQQPRQPICCRQVNACTAINL
jgi:hypothetical protein